MLALHRLLDVSELLCIYGGALWIIHALGRRTFRRHMPMAIVLRNRFLDDAVTALTLTELFDGR